MSIARIPSIRALACAAVPLLGACAAGDPAGDHDLVILGGRVIDPESGLDAVRNVGIRDGGIVAVTDRPITGARAVDAAGLVVGPGFIDMHAHGQDEENYRLQARDGVTTALELEVGVADVEAWYAAREGRALINYGASIGHIPVRMQVMGDEGAFLPSGPAAHQPAAAARLEEIIRRIRRGLEEGAVAVGFGLQYTPAASRHEVLEVFRTASPFRAAAHVHIRYMGDLEPNNAVAALQEVLAASAVTGTPLHIAHVQSSGLRATPLLLQVIGEARERGLDVTAEAYPYTAGMTAIESAIFDDGWQRILGIGYGELEWAATSERLTAESFARYRGQGGSVIIHFIPEEIVELAIASPLTAVASDGRLRDGRGHPRSAGTFARVLGRYARDAGLMDWNEALRKMALIPAQRMEGRVPGMARKGRVQPGADADLVVFDPATVTDRSTYGDPARPSDGIRYVLVGGTPVVWAGEVQEDVRPGQPIRAERGPPLARR